MKNIYIILLTCAFLYSASSQTKYSAQVEEKIKEVEHNVVGRIIVNGEKTDILERMKKYKVKGVSIAVIHNSKIEWAKGYGWANEAEKRPMTTETLFEPGSISKSLNAVGILKLAQDKKIDLNTDINTYLTSWKFPYDSLSRGKKITLTHLLSHQAGLSVHGFPGHDMKGKIPTVYDVLDGKGASFTPPVRSQFEPGLKFQYSGGGTTISQVLLTDVTKQPYDVWMYENVLKPIGMVNSTYAQPPSEEKQRLCASAYSRDGSPVSNKFHVYPEQAAAGLWMTPSDLCNYIIDMQLAYKGGKSKVLSPEMVKLHLTSYNNGPTALGTFIEDHEGAMYFQHGAGNDGFCGIFYGSLDEGNGVVIFMNTDDPKLLGEVMNSIAKAYGWKNFYRAPQKKDMVKVDEKIIDTYEGIYLFENQWAAIGKKDGQHHFYADGTYAKMYFSSPTSFFNEEFASEKFFEKDGKGNITGYKRMVDGKEHPKATKVTCIDSVKLESWRIGMIGWYLFELGKFDESLKYYEHGAKVDPKNLSLKGNMAHTYLLSGNYDKAITIYKAHLNDMISPELSWKKMMQDDLLWFRQMGYNVKPFDKVFAELKIALPEAYTN